MNIVELFETIKKTSSTKEKVQLLKDNDSGDLRYYLMLAYDPRILFNVTSIDCEKTNALVGLLEDFPRPEQFDSILDHKGRNAKLVYISMLADGRTAINRKYIWAIIDKDLGININIKLINKAFPKMIFDFNLQLAHKQSSEYFQSYYKDLDWIYLNQKIDGIRCVCFYNSPDDIKFLTRDGKEAEEFLVENIREDLKINHPELIGHVLDGEISTKNFQQLMCVVNRKKVTPEAIQIRNECRFFLFDVMLQGEFVNDTTKILSERVKDLDKIKESKYLKKISYLKVANDYEFVYKLSRKYILKGCEGIITKHPNMPYEKKRSKNWLKFKNKQTEDLKIVGHFEGEGKYVGMLGGIILDLGNDQQVRCGSGFTDNDRTTLWPDRDNLIGMTAEISFMERTSDGILRHPIFERFRTDK